MRTAFIGCVEFSHSMLSHLLSFPEATVVGVVTRSGSSFHGDFRSLEPLAAGVGAPCYHDDGRNPGALAAWLDALAPDVVFCLGWPFLLPASVLRVPRLGCIGYHPTELPRNRGRHPIIWSLVLGLPRTASSFFFLDAGADSGDLVSQEIVSIEDDDDAGSLYAKLTAKAKDQLEALVSRLSGGRLERTPQDHSLANVWRKRTHEDGRIDWRMSGRSIHNLVRGLARPYPGAHCVYRGREIRVWRTSMRLSELPPFEHLEPGKVLLSGSPGGIVVRSGEGAVLLVEHEFPGLPGAGEYIR